MEEAEAEAADFANENILHFFYGKDGTGLADMANVEGGTKGINTGKIVKAANNFKAQMVLCYNNSKGEMPDFLKKFSYESSNSLGDLIIFSGQRIVDTGIFNETAKLPIQAIILKMGEDLNSLHFQQTIALPSGVKRLLSKVAVNKAEERRVGTLKGQPVNILSGMFFYIYFNVL
jgi:hypothetical protein